MKKIVTILGARPQFVKAAVLSRVIAKYNQIEEIIIHTGQHYDANMSAVFFNEMNIPKPKYNLAINGLGHGAMTGQMLVEIEPILEKERPDLVVVYGDTNSTIAGALAAKKLHIKVAHVEAGLRSFNMAMPEEINRILTDRISDLLLCPTNTAINNLENEGMQQMPSTILNCGDIMKDAVHYYGKVSNQKSDIIDRLKLKKDAFVVATIHRQENTDEIEKLNGIFKGLEAIHKQKQVIIPLHPRTRAILDKNKLKYKLTFIDPVGYYDMMELLKNCNLVVTDSGGLQKEAFFHKKHCVIAREETEWVELVSNGFATTVGANKDKIYETFQSYQDSSADFSMNLFGNEVGVQIYQTIYEFMK